MDSSVEDHKESKRGKPVPVSIRKRFFRKNAVFIFFNTTIYAKYV